LQSQSQKIQTAGRIGRSRTSCCDRTSEGSLDKVEGTDKAKDLSGRVASGRERGEVHGSTVSAPVRVECRRIRIRNDLVIGCVIQVYGSLGRFAGIHSHDILSKNIGKGRLEEDSVAQGAEVGSLNLAKGEGEQVLDTAKLFSLVKGVMAFGCENTVEEGIELSTVCRVCR
jgi:hypothetical protein